MTSSVVKMHNFIYCLVCLAFSSFLVHAKFSPFCCFIRKNDVVHCTQKKYYHQFTQWLFFPTSTPKRRLVCPSFYFCVLGRVVATAKSSHTFSPTATLSASLIKSLSLVLTKPIYFLYLRSYLYIRRSRPSRKKERWL